MWGHPQSVSQSDASYNFYYIDVVTPDAYNSFMADPHFMDLFEAGDIRLDLFQWMREGYLGYRKFRIRADQTGDIVVMRSAEMYLIAAEALAREGQLGAVAREALTKEEAEKKYDCWQQDGSYKEYNPEGHWFTSFPDGTRFVPNSTYYLYSIPEKETNANPNL